MVYVFVLNDYFLEVSKLLKITKWEGGEEGKDTVVSG